jgi:beta-galactosidase
VVIGGDYYPRRLDHDNFHDIVIATEVVRMVSAPDAPVVCPELQAGGNEDRPRVYASDLELLVHTAAGHGLDMVSAYMLAGGENPPGLGCFGTEHDWQAPIGPDGALRPSAEALARFGAFLRSAPRYGATRKRFDTHFGFYAPYFQTTYLRGAPIEALERRRVDVAQDGILRLLSVLSVAYDFVDLTRASDLASRASLWLFAEDWMDRATQERLAAYVLGGGRLCVFPTLPTRDATGAPCTVLADALGGAPRRATTRFVHLVEPKPMLLPATDVSTYDPLAGDAALARDDHGAVAAVLRERGRGRVLLAGFSMRHRFDRQLDVTGRWAESLGVEANVRLTPRSIAAVTRASDDELYLTATNFHEVDAQVSGDVAWRGGRLPIEPFPLPARSARTFLVARAKPSEGAG